MTKISRDPAKVRVYQEPRMLLSVDELARRLSIAKQTVYNGLARRTKNPFPIPHKRFGSKPVFDSKDVERFIERLSYEGIIPSEFLNDVAPLDSPSSAGG